MSHTFIGRHHLANWFFFHDPSFKAQQSFDRFGATRYCGSSVGSSVVFIVLVEPTLHLQFHIMRVKTHKKRDVIATFLAGCHASVSEIIDSSRTAREILLALVIHVLADGAMVLVE